MSSAFLKELHTFLKNPGVQKETNKILNRCKDRPLFRLYRCLLRCFSRCFSPLALFKCLFAEKSLFFDIKQRVESVSDFIGESGVSVVVCKFRYI